MESVFEEKISGGKLLRVKVNYDNNKINSVKITGDFFLYPEESIEEIENILANISTNEDEKSILDKISSVVNKQKIEMIGINPEAIARAVKGAMK